MSSNVSSKISSEKRSKLAGWDAAIRDTEAEILITKERLAGLRSALRVFKERKEKGDPFPGENPKQSEAKA